VKKVLFLTICISDLDGCDRWEKDGRQNHRFDDFHDIHSFLNDYWKGRSISTDVRVTIIFQDIPDTASNKFDKTHNGMILFTFLNVRSLL
jgi:hypothetical protein